MLHDQEGLDHVARHLQVQSLTRVERGQPLHLTSLLKDMPLRGGIRSAPRLAVLLRRLAQVRAPGLPPALGAELGHEELRALQVPVRHANKDQAVQRGNNSSSLLITH